ncbi:MAG: zinc-binding dehydrogenase [Microbacterium sp.]
MRAIVVHGPKDLRVEERDPAPAAQGRVVVEIVYGGICGSDLHYHQRGANGSFVVREPLVLGHEVVGRVAEVGEGASDAPAVGTPVAVHPATPTPRPGQAEGNGMNLTVGGTYLGSASTWPHTQGGFIERLEVAPDQLRILPDDLPLLRAALAEPTAVALHGVDRVRHLIEGADILVSGAGPIGCLVVAALRRRGAGRITVTDLHERPLSVARAVGADETIRLGEAEAPNEHYEIVIEAAGAVPSLVTALDKVRRGGAVVQLGILPQGELPVPLSELINHEITLYGSQRFDVELDEAVALLADDPSLDAVVTDVFDAADAEEAFARAADSAASTKTLVRFAAD